MTSTEDRLRTHINDWRGHMGFTGVSPRVAAFWQYRATHHAASPPTSATMMSLMRSTARTGVSKSWTATIATQHAKPRGHANLPIHGGAPSGPVASPSIVTPRAIIARPSTTPVRSPIVTETSGLTRGD